MCQGAHPLQDVISVLFIVIVVIIVWVHEPQLLNTLETCQGIPYSQTVLILVWLIHIWDIRVWPHAAIQPEFVQVGEHPHAEYVASM